MLGDQNSYFPENAERTSDNRMFAMFHVKTPDHNKDVILKSMQAVDGVVRVVLCTVALGMEVDFAGLNLILQYGAVSNVGGLVVLVK